MTGFVYLITMEPDEYVKIGFTRQRPQARLAALQTGAPLALNIRAYFPGTPDDERRLHRVFAPLAWRGEWFSNELKLRDFLLYFDDTRDVKCATRERFEDALHDCVMQSMWWPGHELSQEDYDASANWEPYRDLLWRVFGPWESV